MSLPASYPEVSRAVPPASAGSFAFALLLAICLHAAIIFGLSFQRPKEAAQATTIIDVILGPPTELLPGGEAQPQPSDQDVYEAHTQAQPSSRSAHEATPTPATTAPPVAATAAQPDKTPPPLTAPTGRTPAVEAPNRAEPHQPWGQRPPAAHTPPVEPPAVSTRSLDYAGLEQRIAAMGLELADQEAAEGLRPRIRHLPSASAQNATEANYLKMWRQKVERIGTANYPGGNLQGDLKVLVAIRHDGALLDVQVLESSGAAKLDSAALRIVRLAAPYAPFPVDMRKSYDQLEIIRTWRFSSVGTRLEG